MNASNLTGGAILGSAVADGDQLYLFDISSSGAARTKSLTVKEARRGLGVFGYNAQSNAAGNITVTPGDFCGDHLEVITASGSAGTRTCTIADGSSTTRYAGNRASLLFVLPGTAGLIYTVLNTAGDTLFTVQDDGSGDDCRLDLYHNGTKWQTLGHVYPV